MKSVPIVVQQSYPVPIDTVWKAITEPEQMRDWFFASMDDFRPEVGFATEFDVAAEDQIFRHQWKVTEVVPPRKIAYDWTYAGYQGESRVTWELSETPEGTRLTVSHHGQETFDQDNPLFSREAGEEGWRYFLQDTLAEHLGGGAVS